MDDMYVLPLADDFLALNGVFHTSEINTQHELLNIYDLICYVLLVTVYFVENCLEMRSRGYVT